MVLKGEAKLLWEDGDELITEHPSGHVMIPAQWTSPAQPTVLLAVFFGRGG